MIVRPALSLDVSIALVTTPLYVLFATLPKGTSSTLPTNAQLSVEMGLLQREHRPAMMVTISMEMAVRVPACFRPTLPAPSTPTGPPSAQESVVMASYSAFKPAMMATTSMGTDAVPIASLR